MTNKEAYDKIIQDQCYRRCRNSEPYPNCIADGCEYYIALERILDQKECFFVYDEASCDYKCSVCGHFTASEFDMEDEYFEIDGKKGWVSRMPHYCKHCGARASKERLTVEEQKELIDLIRGV